MSPFSRFIQHAFCCFYLPHLPEDEERQSSSQAASNPVLTRSLPYAMVNVPHEPEMTDLQAFRRLFTQSPACPHEDTPIASSKVAQQVSSEMEYAFRTGSPAPIPKKSTSLQKISRHVKQKLSESRLSRGSSRNEERDTKFEQEAEMIVDTNSGSLPLYLGVSATSTGLSELLKSRNGSVECYDRDAKPILTPQMRSRVDDFELKLENADETSLHRETPSSGSGSYLQPSLTPAEKPSRTSLSRKAGESLGSPSTPERFTFSQALRLHAGESSEVALKRLSTGMADGTIKPPTTYELRLFSTPLRETLERPSPAASTVTTIKAQSLTPQTVIKRLTERIKSEQKAGEQMHGTGNDSSDLLHSLEPALIEYLVKPSPSKTSNEDGSNLTFSEFECSLRNVASPTVLNHEVRESQELLRNISCAPSKTDVVSVASSTLHSVEQQSVHLYDMHISQHLASKSTTTMLSQLAAANESNKSFETNLALTNKSAQNFRESRPQSYQTRAEHNRKPSDPSTRRIFEQPQTHARLSWSQRGGSMSRPKVTSNDRDDNSSAYTYDEVPPSSSSRPSLTDCNSNSKNLNSLAIGGRSASSDIAVRRRKPNDVKSIARAPNRSLSTSAAANPEILESASSIISRYLDGSLDNGETASCIIGPAAESTNKQLLQQATTTKDGNATHNGHDYKPSSVYSSYGRDSADETNSQLEKEMQNGSSKIPTPSHHISDVSGAAVQASRSEATEESTMDMWNRAYQDAQNELVQTFTLTAPFQDLSEVRRRSSCGIIRPNVQTSRRRSQSAEPCPRHSFTSKRKESRRTLSQSLRRLSLKHLRSHISSISPKSSTMKLQKRSSFHPSSKHPLADDKTSIRHQRAAVLRNKPSSMWTSFSSHNRGTRNGPAGLCDMIDTHDFAHRDSELGCDGVVSSGRQLHDGALSVLSNRRQRFNLWSRKLDRKRTQSMSIVVDARDLNPSSRGVPSLNRIKQLYRSSSSEGLDNKIVMGQQADYPDLEPLPGDGLFEWPRHSVDPSADLHGQSSVYKPSTSMDTWNGIANAHGDSDAILPYPQGLWRKRSDSSLCEAVVYPSRNATPILSMAPKGLENNT